MKKKFPRSILLFAIILAAFGNVNAQTWDWTKLEPQQNQIQHSVATDAQGYIYVLGTYDNGLTLNNNFITAGQGNYIAKYDSAGVLYWYKLITFENGGPGGPDNVITVSEFTINTTGIYLTGYLPSGSTGSVPYNYVIGNSVFTVDTLGQYKYYSKAEFYVCKMDFNGNVVWNKTSNLSSITSYKSMGITSDKNNNIIISGDKDIVSPITNPPTTFTLGDAAISYSPDINYRFTLFYIKISPSGDIQWSNFVKDPYDGNPTNSRSMVCDNNNDIFVYANVHDGSQFGNITFSTVHNQYPVSVLAKLSSGGTWSFVKELSTNNNSEHESYGDAKYLTVDEANNIYALVNIDPAPLQGVDPYIAGNPIPNTNAALSMYVVKFKNDGSLLWTKNFGEAVTPFAGSLDNSANAISFYNGKLLLTGSIRAFQPNPNPVYPQFGPYYRFGALSVYNYSTVNGIWMYFTAQSDAELNFDWANLFNSNSNAEGFAVTKYNNNIYTAGICQGSIQSLGNLNDPFGLVSGFYPFFGKIKNQFLRIGIVTPTKLCTGNTFTVPFTSYGLVFSNSNSFTAQLSDSLGNFTNASNIGSVVSTGTGTISATLPDLPSGSSGYHVRIMSSDLLNTGQPYYAYADTGYSITVGGKTFYQDADGDGFGNISSTIIACNPPAGYVADSSDCNDADVAVHAPPVIVNITTTPSSGTDGSINITATGATEYSIDGLNFYATSSFSDLAPGMYTVYARAGASCISTQIVTVLLDNAVINIPTAPVLSNPTTTSLDITIGSGDNNPVTTEYAIFSAGDGPYVQANGLIGVSPVWQTAAMWGTITVSGLVSNGSYDFEVKARNGSGTETNLGAFASLSTLAITPGAPTVDGATVSSLNVTLDVNGNYPWTTFAIYETTTNKYVQADGSLGVSAVWQTNATWGTKTVTGLTSSTTYTFEIKAINQDNVETAFGTATNGMTLCNPIAITGQPLNAQTVCMGSLITNLNVTATGDGLTYQWYSNNTNGTGGATNLYPSGIDANFTPSAAISGTVFYYCIVTGTCGAVLSDFARVDVNPIPLVNAGSYGPYLLTDAPLTLIGSPLGGSFIGDGVVGNVFSPAAAGLGDHTITYFYMDALTGCNNTATTSISVATPVIPCNFTVDTIAGPKNACSYVASGVNATYSIATNSASSFSWVLPSGATLVSGSNATNSIQVHYANNFSSGTISVTVSSLCGGPITRTQLITKSIPAAPAAITGNVNACPSIGTAIPVTYSILPVPGAVSYRWTLPATVTLLSASPDSTSITITFNTGFDAGTNKSIRVKSISGCGNSADRVLNISVTKPGIPAAITGATNACLYIGTPDAATYKTRLVTNATSYLWTVPVGATITSHPNGTGAQDTVITVAFDNNFVSPSNISVQSVSGCGISSARTFAVTRTIPATPGAITGTTDACPLMGTAISSTYTIRKVTNALFYNWIVPAGATAIHMNGTGITDTAIVVNYNNTFVSGSITVNASNGCGNSPDRSLVITRKVPATPGAITGPADPCPLIGGPDVTYIIRKVTNATSYSWTVPAGAVITGHPYGVGINDTTILVSFSNAVTTGNISVIANNNCASSLPRNLAIARKLPASPGVIAGPTDPCPFIGFANVTYSIRKVANATSYSWSVPSGVTISGHPNGVGINDTVITVTISNTFTTGNITVTANNNCAISLPRSLALVKKLPGVPGAITATSLSTACPNRQYYYSIAALPANATSISWTIPAGGTMINQGTLSITVGYSTAAVSDTIRVVGVNNCASSGERKLKVSIPVCSTSSLLAEGATIEKATATSDNKEAVVFQMTISPNPSSSYFRLNFISNSSEIAHMRVIDNLGRQITGKEILPNQITEFGNELGNGFYFVEVIQGSNRKVLKILKMK